MNLSFMITLGRIKSRRDCLEEPISHDNSRLDYMQREIDWDEPILYNNSRLDPEQRRNCLEQTYFS